MSRLSRLVVVLVVLLGCCAILASSFEVAKKKTDKAPIKESKPASVKSSKKAAAATISPEGAVEVDATAPLPSGGKVPRAAPAVVEEFIDGPVTVQLEHDLTGEGRWSARGAVEIAFASGSSARSGARFSDVKVGDAEAAQLKALAASGGFYRVRAHTNSSDVNSRYVVASTRAVRPPRHLERRCPRPLPPLTRPRGLCATLCVQCSLIASSLHEHLVFHLDIHAQLLSMTYTTPITVCPPSPPSGPLPSALTSKAKLSFGRTAEKPSNIRIRLQPGEVSAAGGGGADGVGGGAGGDAGEQSFFAKYWMYIVPFVGFVLLQGLMGAMGDQKDGGSGGAQAAGGGGGGGGTSRSS